MFRSLIQYLRTQNRQRQYRKAEAALPMQLEQSRRLLQDQLQNLQPRILVLKQDVNEDLYCCPPNTGPADLIASTLLRTGPVCLFSDLQADFRIVRTVDDEECRIWQERATALHWDSLEFFSSYRDKVPGRDYGQSRWAVDPSDIDYAQYDIVISMDVCVPQRITAQYPNTLWCYYVREIKAPSYAASLRAPAAGQDIVLNHHFRVVPPALPKHVLEFPYHVHRPGCFHRLFNEPEPAFAQRSGVFVDHHTMVRLSSADRRVLQTRGPLTSTVHAGDREVIPTSEQLARRTMDPDLRSRLMNSRYFLMIPGQRIVFGTAMVEAIAAGCLVIGAPHSLGRHSFFLTPQTTATDVSEALTTMQHLDSHPEAAAMERERQQQLVEYLCFVRPVLDLLRTWKSVTSTRSATSVASGVSDNFSESTEQCL